MHSLAPVWWAKLFGQNLALILIRFFFKQLIFTLWFKNISQNNGLWNNLPLEQAHCPKSSVLGTVVDTARKTLPESQDTLSLHWHDPSLRQVCLLSESRPFLHVVLNQICVRMVVLFPTILVKRQRSAVGNWLTWLWRLAGPKICREQTQDPGSTDVSV